MGAGHFSHSATNDKKIQERNKTDILKQRHLSFVSSCLALKQVI